MIYDWVAALVFVGTLTTLTVVGKFLVFKVPALQRMRELNNEADHQKMSRKRYREAVKINNKSARHPLKNDRQMLSV